MTPLETLLVCLAAAAGVGMLRFAARAPVEGARRVVRDTGRTSRPELPRQAEVKPLLSRSPLRRAS
jgi:hypothetical protein